MKPPSRAKIAALESLLAEARRLTHKLRNVTEEIHGAGALPGGLRSLLEELRANGPQTVPQLARANGVSRQHVQTAVNKLVADELVTWTINPAHRRSKLAQVTPSGIELLDEVEAREQTLLGTLRISLSKKELRGAANTIKFLRELFGGDEWKRAVR